MAEIDFGGDIIWFCSFPLMVGSIADFEIKLWRIGFLETRGAIGNPIEVFLTVVDHLFG